MTDFASRLANDVIRPLIGDLVMSGAISEWKRNALWAAIDQLIAEQRASASVFAANNPDCRGAGVADEDAADDYREYCDGFEQLCQRAELFAEIRQTAEDSKQ